MILVFESFTTAKQTVQLLNGWSWSGTASTTVPRSSDGITRVRPAVSFNYLITGAAAVHYREQIDAGVRN